MNKQIFFRTYGYIYIATVLYAIAAFGHLAFKEWSLKKSLLFAMPVVFVEYIFFLRGNHNFFTELKLNPLQILIITMIFYFINVWLLNVFVIKKPINAFREIFALLLVVSAFAVSDTMKEVKKS